MHTKEYLGQLKSLENDGHNPELHSYIAAWVRSRQPGIYKDLVTDFKYIEGELYAHYECCNEQTRDFNYG
jgi:hypothetical protein